ncbi:MAG: hypothetical protein DI629_00150 [Mesorhizobium amorphae]|nr:MAG: hypothetical protein DI629_00150 [Mesorhizobium amorphae]
MPDKTATAEKQEDVSIRRTPGRSEDPITLDEQLEIGLEDTFPASDPISVLSTTIAGKEPRVKGTDEILAEKRQKREKRASYQAERHRERTRRRGEGRFLGQLLAPENRPALVTGGLIVGGVVALGAIAWAASQSFRRDED